MREAHAGRAVTCVQWSPQGDVIFAGDDRGAVSIVTIGAPPSDTAVAAFAMHARVVQCGSRVCQVHVSPGGHAALVSTHDAAVLVAVHLGGKNNAHVGSKPREGLFGGCFHAHAKSAAPEASDGACDDILEMHKPAWMVCARPGKRCATNFLFFFFFSFFVACLRHLFIVLDDCSSHPCVYRRRQDLGRRGFFARRRYTRRCRGGDAQTKHTAAVPSAGRGC